MLPLSIMGVDNKNNQKFIVDEYASHVTPFSIKALSLELAALANIKEDYIVSASTLHYD